MTVGATYAELSFYTLDLGERPVHVEVFIHFGVMTAFSFPTYCCGHRIADLRDDATCPHCKNPSPVPWGLKLDYCLTSQDRTALRARLEEILVRQSHVNVLETPLLADKIVQSMNQFIDGRREVISDEKRSQRLKR